MRSEPDRRPDPEALLAAQAKASRARLRIFLGAAPGVGKTYEMLTQARRLQAEGRAGIVAGIIETHGRAETAAQLGDLAVLPRLRIPYRGQTLEEFDLDAALALRPSLVLVDELAHSNAPGSRHARRWEDVAELIAAGIPVWTTLNIQHLESLNDTVLRITGVRVAETLPDHVLELADEIELIDLSPADLRARLAAGRVYRPDVATRALGGFFREGNLQALREIALRRTAQHVDAGLLDYMRASGIPGPWPAGERVLALVGPEAGEPVLRAAKRLADALHAPWLALHVEPAGEAAAAAQAVARLMALAAELGAEIETRAVRTAGEGIVGIALEVAQARNVSQIVVGRARRRPLRGRLLAGRACAATWRRRCWRGRRTMPCRWCRPGAAAPVRHRPDPPPGWQPGRDVGGVGRAGAAGGRAGRGAARPGGAGRARHAVPGRRGRRRRAVRAGRGAGHRAGVVPGLELPVHPAALRVHDRPARATWWRSWCSPPWPSPPAWSRAGSAPRRGRRRAGSRACAGSAPSRAHSAARSPSASCGDEIVRQAASIASRALVLAGRETDGELDIRAAEPPADTMDEASWAAALWSWRHGEPAGRGTGTLPAAPWRFLPIRIAGAAAGRTTRRRAAPAGWSGCSRCSRPRRWTGRRCRRCRRWPTRRRWRWSGCGWCGTRPTPPRATRPRSCARRC